MAIYDSINQTLILRVVYDGAGLAGKTTSLKAISSRLGCRLESPGEALGRTLYFDWLDHDLPRSGAEKVKVQIVSVPGQKGLDYRRRSLLAAADAIVFVIDSKSANAAVSIELLRQLRQALGQLEEPQPAIVLQANKRDDGDALAVAQLRGLEEAAGLPLFESVAIEGDGLMAPLSEAVRLALLRADLLAEKGLLVIGEVAVGSSGSLMESLNRGEAEDGGTANAFGEDLTGTSRSVASGLAEEVKVSRGHLVALPSPRQLKEARSQLLQGGVWPPVAGPDLVAEALALAGRRGGFDPAAGPVSSFGPWRVQSLEDRVYESQETALAILRQWARSCEEERRKLSNHRWLAVLREPEGWRIWQGVRSQPSLQDLAAQRHLDLSDEALVLRWVHLAAALQLGMKVLVSSSLGLSSNRQMIGLHRSQPVFIGLLPVAQGLPDHQKPEEAQQELWSMILASLRASRRDPELLAQVLRKLAFASPTLAAAAESVDEVLRRTDEILNSAR